MNQERKKGVESPTQETKENLGESFFLQKKYGKVENNYWEVLFYFFPIFFFLFSLTIMRSTLNFREYWWVGIMV